MQRKLIIILTINIFMYSEKNAQENTRAMLVPPERVVEYLVHKSINPLSESIEQKEPSESKLVFDFER